MPLISVIVPTYGRPRELTERCLPSVFAQTVRDQEVLVVGDGTDVVSVAEMKADDRVRFWNLPHFDYPEDQTRRWGLLGLAALNWGLDHAQGEWIAVLADDDEWTPDHHEILLVAAERTGADHVYGISDTYKNGKLIGQTYGAWPPGDGQFCVPSGTHIGASGVLGAYRRQYDGPMVRIITKSGRHLSCTPNHRIATSRGWIESDVLQIGEDVIASVLGDGQVSWYPNIDDMPSPVEEIFDSFAISPEWMVRPRMDFHGDEILNRQVDVVGTNGLLGLDQESFLGEPFSESFFPSSDVASISLFFQGYFQPRTRAVFLFPKAIMGSPGKRQSFFDGHTGILVEGGAGQRPSGGRVQVEQAQDRSLGDQEMGSQRNRRGSPSIETDEIVYIDRVPFSGHVYNLTTESGHYVANGIVTHNCNGANLYRASLGYRYDLNCWDRNRTGDADLWLRMVEDGVKFHFEPRLVHKYHRSWP